MRTRAAALIAVAIVLSACGTSTATESPSPSTATPTPTAWAGSNVPTPTLTTPPTATPLPTATSTAVPLAGDGGIAEVVTNDLVVRSLPEISDRSVIDRVMLDAGKLLFVTDGPVAADGYDWYHVQPFGEADSFRIRWPSAGWVAAASQQGDPWVAARVTACPRSTDLEMDRLAKLHPLEALACFGDRTIRVRGRDLICPGAVADEPPVPNYKIVPEWLGLGQDCALHGAAGRVVYNAATLYFAPGVLGTVPSGWAWLTGQFDHSAARSCVLRRQAGDPDLPAAPDLDDVQTVLLCRSHFAVTSAEAAQAPSD